MKYIVVAVIMLAALTAHAQQAPCSILTNRASAYRQEMAKVASDAVKQEQAWPDQYLQALKTLEQKFGKAGDLDGILAIRKETKRFQDEKQLPEEAVAEYTPDLAALQKKAIRLRREIEQNRRTAAGAATDRYLAALRALKKDLTKQGLLEEAIRAKDEIASVQADATAAGLPLAPEEIAAPKPPPAVKKAEGRQPVAEKEPARKAITGLGSKATKKKSPLGKWSYSPEGMPSVMLIVILHKNGKWEAVGDQVWNGTFTFLNDEMTRLERKSNGQVSTIEWNPETDELVQDGPIYYTRVRE